MHLPDGLAAELSLWKRQCPDPSPEAFIFASADGGAIDTANYRSRILRPLAEELGIPKLNFQVLRRTMATRAQNLGSVKDIQSHLRHSRADTTANEYMQELPESVQQMVGSVYRMLTTAASAAAGDVGRMQPVEPAHLMPTGAVWHQMASTYLCQGRYVVDLMVGTAGFEPTTSTV